MKPPSSQSPEAGRRSRTGERGQTRIVAFAVVFLLLGFAGGAFWFDHYANTRGAATGMGGPGNSQPAGLSDATKAVLQRLQGPAELRYYSLLDPTGASDALKEFAGRVDQLLSQYEQESGGKLSVVRHHSQSDDSTAAFADGLKPFNMDKGDACYLGIVVIIGTNKEALPQLAAEWEQAVEPDLTRAIARLEEAPGPVGAVSVAPIKAKTMDEVKQAFPDVATISVDEGTQRLRAAAFREFSDAANEFTKQINDAQQRLTQAQNGGTEAEQQAALKNLQDLQAAQTAKLQAIAAQSQALIDAFKQLKKQAGGQ